MPRPTHPYETVAAEADALAAENLAPQTRTIRERLLAKGISIGPNKVQEYLDRWRAEHRPLAGPAQLEALPASLVRELTQFAQSVAASARAGLEEDAATLKTEKQDLLASYAALETTRESLEEQLVALTTERDTLQGQHGAQSTEIEKLTRDRERERRAAEEARVEVAQGRLASAQQTQLVETLQTDLAALRAAFDTEKTARLEAERQQAGLAAQAAALVDQVKDLQARETRVRDELDSVRTAQLAETEHWREQREQLTQELRATDTQRARAEGAAEAANAALARIDAQLKEQGHTLQEVRQVQQTVSRENARLTEQLAQRDPGKK